MCDESCFPILMFSCTVHIPETPVQVQSIKLQCHTLQAAFVPCLKLPLSMCALWIGEIPHV